MKPSWKYSPSWANYLAMDPDDWYWYEFQPLLGDHQFHSVGGRIEKAYPDYDNWRESLEKRPKYEEVE